eukprot:6187519-Pleurochrysis_carterae.AAC.5
MQANQVRALGQRVTLCQPGDDDCVLRRPRVALAPWSTDTDHESRPPRDRPGSIRRTNLLQLDFLPLPPGAGAPNLDCSTIRRTSILGDLGIASRWCADRRPARRLRPRAGRVSARDPTAAAHTGKLCQHISVFISFSSLRPAVARTVNFSLLYVVGWNLASSKVSWPRAP